MPLFLLSVPKRSRGVLALLLLLTAPLAHAQAPAPWGTGQSKGEDLVISLVTFGVGDEIISWFGHSALVVEDKRLRMGRLYNYGMFSFDQGMLNRFAMGRLEFWVGEAGVWPTYQFYKEDNRDVRIQVLNFTPEQREQIAKALADNVLPANRDYLYHHYYDNCSTRPRDMIDRAIGGQLSKATSKPARYTLRDHTRRYSAVNPPMSVLLDFLMNDEIDKPITQKFEAFLPDELHRQVEALQFERTAGEKVSLVESNNDFFKSTGRPPTPEEPPKYGPWLLLIGLVLGAIPLALVLLTKGSPRLLGLHSVVVGFVFGLAGLILFLMGSFTNHTVTHRNENLFLANPVTLCTFVWGLRMLFKKSEGGRRWLLRGWVALAVSGTVGLLVKVLPWFDQDNWRLIALILPVSLGTALAFVLDQRRRTV